MELSNARPFDCVIVAGGPAGLTAAIYLARYHRSIVVFDIWRKPCFTDSGKPQLSRISGRHLRPLLLTKFRKQAEAYDTTMICAQIAELKRDGALFESTKSRRGSSC
jgi:thioredoxin reductase (NADPH)